MAFIISVFVTILIAFVSVGIILIPYFYGCYALWLKLRLLWKVVMPVIYGLLVYFAIKFELFQFVFRFLGMID